MAETRTAHLGRLNFLTIFDDVQHQMGDAMETVGQVPTIGEPRPNPFTVSFPVYPGSGEAQTEAQRLRRQILGMLANRAARAYLWFAFDIDTEISAWLAVGGAELAEVDGGTTFSRWKLTLTDTFVVGRPQTFRPAKRLHATDLRAATAARDYRQTLFSSDFVSLSASSLHYLPFGATDVVGVGRTPLTSLPTRTTKAGAIPVLVGRSDQEVVSYEQPTANRNSDADVVIYDRRGLGLGSKPTGGPDPLWEEVYGPGQPLTAADTPVLENGICRIRQGQNGSVVNIWAVDIWTGSVWAEQGSIELVRVGDTTTRIDTVVSSSVLEYTPDRAVIAVVMRSSTDSRSRETAIFTLQRGWTGPRVELYLSPKSTGRSDGRIGFHLVSLDTNASAVKIDAAGGAINTSSGTGSQLWPTANIGAATFTGENLIAVNRQGAAYGVTLAVVQAGARGSTDTGSSVYLATRNIVNVDSSATSGYVSVQYGFYLQRAAQIVEAESMTLGSGTTSVVDAAASNGNTAQSTRTADAIHVSTASWDGAVGVKYRMLARVKTSASTLNLYAKTSGGTGATKTTTSTSYVWVDLGDVVGTGTLELHDWATAAATTSVDRIEAFRVEAGSTGLATYDGARDLAKSVLYNARQVAAIQER